MMVNSRFRKSPHQERSYFYSWMTTAILFISIGMAPAGAMADLSCSVSSHVATPPIKIASNPRILLGRFPKPDTGVQRITIAPDGARTISNAIDIGDRNRNQEIFKPATFFISGGRNCRFQVTIESLSSGRLSFVRLAPGRGYSLSSSTSGARGILDGAGEFKFTVGVTAQVDATVSGAFNDSFTVRVSYY